MNKNYITLLIVLILGHSGFSFGQTPATITPVSDIFVNEEAPQQTILLTGITDGDSPIATPNTTLTAESSNTELIANFRATIDSTTGSTGTFVFTPAPDRHGITTITLTVTDLDGSNQTTFNITVNNQNDQPLITSQQQLSTPEETTLLLSLEHISVTDADNNNTPTPQTFSLQITQQTGTGYTTSGLNIIPNTDFNGTLTVPITVTDNGTPALTSEVFNLQIEVTPTNDPPVVVAQQTLTTAEETAITITIDHLTITDADNNNTPTPQTFTLQITQQAGAGYTTSGLTITPDTDFNGTLSIPVTVTDNGSPAQTSAPFNLQIEVTATNDQPVITNQQSLTTAEETPVTLTLDHLAITDADNNHTPTPQTFALQIAQQTGTGYTASGLTITPAANFNGTLSIPITVTDNGTPALTSEIFNLQIDVTTTNDQPIITNQELLTTPEETPITLTLEHIAIFDADNTDNPTPQTFTLHINELTGNGYTANDLTIFPTPEFNGTLSLPITVTDNGTPALTSEVFTLHIEVTATNDQPVITNQQPLTTEEETPLTIAINHLTITDADNNNTPTPQTFTFQITQLTGSGYTASGHTITPATDFNGLLFVPISVTDNGTPALTSEVYNLQIEVTGTNDQPIITSQQPLSTREETPILLSLDHLHITDADNLNTPSTQTFTLQITEPSGANYISEGLVISPITNFNGTLSVPVTVTDNGMPALTSEIFELQIEVTTTNDQPEITAQQPLSTHEETPITLSLEHLTISDADNSNNPTPQTFTLQITETTGTDYSAEGLTITPNPDFSGTLWVPVTVSDNGTPQLTSEIYNLQIDIIPTNDPPAITNQQLLSTQEETPITLTLNNLTISDADNTNNPTPQTFTLQIAASTGSGYTSIGNTIAPSANFNGTLSIPVTVTDNGTPALTSEIFYLQIAVTPINDRPVITNQQQLSTQEETSLSLSLNHLTISDEDNTNNSTPQTFTLQINQPTGTGYSATGLTITPASNFNGTLSVPVTITDNGTPALTSDIFLLQIEVTATNDQPVINRQETLLTPEETPITLSLNQLIITDADNTTDPASQDFTLQIIELTGEGYAASGLSITPAPDFNGTLSVPITVTDNGIPALTSEIFNLQIVVTPINDAPQLDNIGATSVTYIENSTNTIITSTLSITDPDNLTIPGASVSISPSTFHPSEDQLTFSGTSTIAANWNNLQGTLTLSGEAPIEAYTNALRSVIYQNLSEAPSQAARVITFSISDGALPSNTLSRNITITAVNDAPVIINSHHLTRENESINIEVLENVMDYEDNLSNSTLTITSMPTNGSARVRSRHVEISYTPEDGYSGRDEITYRMCDTENACSEGVLSISISDEAPRAVNDLLTTTEDTPGRINLLQNDTDPQNNIDPTTLSILTNSTLGEITIEAEGDISFSPHTNTYGTETLNYTICDATSYCSNGAITITITPVNDAPITTGDFAETEEDGIVTIDVLGNDHDNNDPEGGINTTTLRIITPPNHGTATPDAFGRISYQPDANFNGADNFIYEIADTGFPFPATSSPGTVNITVSAVNDQPEAMPDHFYTAENTSVNMDVTINDTDLLDGENGGINPSSITIVSPPEHGSVIILPNHQLTYSPYRGFYGQDTLQYSISDLGYPGPELSDTASIIIEVSRRSPLAMDDTFQLPEDTPTLLNLLQNDVDSDIDPASIEIITPPAHGHLETENETISYIPDLNYFGTDSFTYQVSDLTRLTSNQAMARIRITPVPDPPIVINSTFELGQEKTLTIAIDRISEDGDDNINPDTFYLLTGPFSGEITLANAFIIYTPTNNYTGEDSISFQISDSTELTSEIGFIHFTITAQAPNPRNDRYTIAEDQPTVFTVLSNDTDPQNNIVYNTLSIYSAPSHGSTLINYDTGEITYTPELNFNGRDQFTYNICDATGYCATGRASVTVTPINDAPAPSNDTVSINEDEVSLIDILQNDIDVDNDLLTSSVQITSPPSHGQLTWLPQTQRIQYQGRANFNGSDRFTYRISDEDEAFGEASVIIEITPVNDTPQIEEHTFTIMEDMPQYLNLLSLSSDPENGLDSCSISIITYPEWGEITNTEDCMGVTYSPKTDFVGQDQLTFEICDNQGLCSSATVSLYTQQTNDAPLVQEDFVQTNEDMPVEIDVLHNDFDTDLNIDPTTLSVVIPPSQGSVRTSNYKITYTPAPNATGIDTFTYSLCDSLASCGQARVTVEILPLNDQPEANNDTVKIRETILTSINVLINDIDVEGDFNLQSLSITVPPAQGIATIEEGVIFYTSFANHQGKDQLSYSICDASKSCDIATVVINITSKQAPPTTITDLVSTNEDEPVFITPLTNDTDINNNINPASLSVVAPPLNGNYSIHPNENTISYQGYPDFFGVDTLLYQICDSTTPPLCTTGTIVITVKPINDAPATRNDNYYIEEGQTLQIYPIENDSDSEGDPITFKILHPSKGLYGDFNRNSDKITYTSATGYYCVSETISYEACDHTEACDTGQIVITINPMDTDYDHIPDIVETYLLDSDNDNTPDYLDDDSDNDGLWDLEEAGINDMCLDAPVDSDNDGTPDYLSLDSDSDLFPDEIEGSSDCDQDELPNYRDNFDDCAERLKAPDTFSPNGDGINDLFVIPGAGDYSSNELFIFNRWGGQVYYTTNYNNNWDGSSSSNFLGSEALPEGTYFYILKLGSNEKAIMGTVYIKR